MAGEKEPIPNFPNSDLEEFVMTGISDEQYEELRQILVRVNGKPYTFEDAKEIGDGLVDFYIMLWEWDEEESDD